MGKLIRLADQFSEHDLSGAAEVINQAFLKQVVARTDRPTMTVTDLKNHLSHSDKELALVCDGDQVIGAGLMTLENTFAYFWCVSVLPEVQGAHIGIDLMKFLEQRALLHKKKMAYLTVVFHPKESQEALMRWYESQGYVYVEDQAPMSLAEIWKPEFHDGIILRVFQKDLTKT